MDDEFLDAVAKDFPHIGMLYIDPESGELMKAARPITLQDVKDTITDSDIPLYMCFSKEDVGDDYDQPTVFADEGKPLCGVIIEGDLKDKPPTSSKPTEFHIVNDYLRDKIIDVAADADNDLDKLAERFNRPTTHRDILANISPGESGRCELFMLFANGKTAHISKGNGHRSFDWGFASHDPNGGAPVVAEPAAKRGGILGRAANKANGGTSPAAITTGKNNEPLAKPVVLVLPSKNRCSDRKNLLGWYKQYSGLPTTDGLPDGWEQAVEHGWDTAIPVPLKAYWLEGGAADFAKKVKENQVIIFDAAKHVRKQVPPKTGTGAPATKEGGDDGYVVLVTPAPELSKLITTHKSIKTMDDTSKLVLPASKLDLALASPFPTASAELGLKSLDELEGISEDGFYLYTKDSPRWAARLITQLILDRMLLKAAKAPKQGKVAM